MKKTSRSTPSSSNSMWTSVTPLSKAVAMVLFVTLPFVGFVLGMVYQQALNGL